MSNIFSKLFEVKKAGIKLQRDTEAFKYSYATLSQIQEKLSKEFEDNNLLVVHYIKDNSVYTEIRDIENEEQYVQSSISMSEGVGPQDKGSEITYYRRYNLLSLLDLEVEDDDGKKAQNSKSTSKSTSKSDDLPWIGDSNIATLKELVESGTAITFKDVNLKYKISKVNRAKLEAIGIK